MQVGPKDPNSLFLSSLDVEEHPVQSENTLFQGTRVLRYLSWFYGSLSAGFAFDHDIEIDEFFGER